MHLLYQSLCRVSCHKFFVLKLTFSIITLNDLRAGDAVAFFCNSCFDEFHKDEDGKLLENPDGFRFIKIPDEI